jgi:hypothetical protein
VVAVSKELNLPESQYSCHDLVIDQLMVFNGYSFDIETVYTLMESMQMPSRGFSIQVCMSMLPSTVPQDKNRRVRSLVHALLQLKMEGYLHYMVHYCQ